MVMGEGHNDDNDATEMTTVIMINNFVTDHDDDDDDDGVGEGLIHDSDGGGNDGQEEEKDGGLDHDKSLAQRQDVMHMLSTVNLRTCGVLDHSRATLIKQPNKVTSGLTYDIFYPAYKVDLTITEGSLEAKLPTIWTDGKAEVERVREEKESEKE